MRKFLVVVAGPTASGKTDLAIKLALHFKTVIVSADSRQFFREMEIGTAKPTSQQLASVKHYFINSHSLSEHYSAGRYAEDCEVLLSDLFTHHNLVIMAGGSGLYIDTAAYGLDVLPVADEKIRKELNQSYLQNGITILQEELKKSDPEGYRQIDIHNPRRLIRALEICRSSGLPYSRFLNRKNKIQPWQTVYLALEVSREELYKRINDRTNRMMEAGLADEVRRLMPFKNNPAMRTVGYQELMAFIEGRCSLETAVDKIKQHTRNYAKRQMTWFRKNKSIQWVDQNDTAGIISFIEKQTKA